MVPALRLQAGNAVQGPVTFLISLPGALKLKLCQEHMTTGLTLARSSVILACWLQTT